MRQACDYTKIDDAGRPLERMGGAHENLQLLRRGECFFDLEQSRSQQSRLVFGLDPKEVEHRKIAQVVEIVLLHVRLRLKAENKGSGSSKPTSLSRQKKMPWA